MSSPLFLATATPATARSTLSLHDALPICTEYTMALLLDDLMGSREVVVKPLGPQLSTVPGLSGATILGVGNVVVVLDFHSLIRPPQVQRRCLAAQARRAQWFSAHATSDIDMHVKA